MILKAYPVHPPYPVLFSLTPDIPRTYVAVITIITIITIYYYSTNINLLRVLRVVVVKES